MPFTTTPDRFDCDEIITSFMRYGVAPTTPLTLANSARSRGHSVNG